MRRGAILIAALSAMLWQSVALARAGITVEALADLQHTVHDQDQGHHDVGSFHLGATEVITVRLTTRQAGN
jgi:hypothetical protein